jgi:hypothetical protein
MSLRILKSKSQTRRKYVLEYQRIGGWNRYCLGWYQWEGKVEMGG